MVVVNRDDSGFHGRLEGSVECRRYTSVLLLDPGLDRLSGRSSTIIHVGDGGDDLLCEVDGVSWSVGRLKSTRG
mgnify:FL=1